MQAVEAEQAAIAGSFDDKGLQVRITLQQRLLIEVEPLPPIDFAALDGCRRGRGIGNNGPFHPIKKNAFRPGGPGRRAIRPGNVAVEFGIGDARTGHPLIGQKAKRAAADHFCNLLERVRARQPFRHDRADIWPGLTQRVRQPGERRMQPELNGAVIRCRQVGRNGEKGLAKAVPHAPPLDAGHAIPGQNGRVVMKAQAVPQRQTPEFAVVPGRVPGQHLQLRAELLILAIERVEHGKGVIAGDVGRRENRVEDGKVGLRDHLERRFCLRAYDCGGCESRCTSEDDCPTGMHPVAPCSCVRFDVESSDIENRIWQAVVASQDT